MSYSNYIGSVFQIKLFYDLHIHSILSPCADDLMTPNNILNMAMLQGLDIIAITDHNTTKQLEVIQELEESYDFIVIPGVEVTVSENFDVLCYFRSYEDAHIFDKFLEKNLTDNWGNYTEEDQMITNIYDLPKAFFDKSLQGTTIPYKALAKEVRKLNGAIILAHIDRKKQSPLRIYSLEELDFDGIEIQKYFKDSFQTSNPELGAYKRFFSSDSHSLLQLSEKEESIELPEKTVDSFINYLRGQNNE